MPRSRRLLGRDKARIKPRRHVPKKGGSKYDRRQRKAEGK